MVSISPKQYKYAAIVLLFLFAIAPFLYYLQLDNSVSYSIQSSNAVVEGTEFNVGKIVDVASTKSGYVILTRLNVSEPKITDYEMLGFSPDHQLQWRYSYRVSVLNFPPHLTTSEDYIVLTFIFANSSVTVNNYLYSGRVNFLIYSHDGTFLKNFSYVNVDLVLSGLQSHYARNIVFEYIDGNNLYFVDYVLSDAANGDDFRVNITKYDLQTQQISWATNIFESASLSGNIAVVPGSYDITKDMIEFKVVYQEAGREVSKYFVGDFEIRATTGQILSNSEELMTCQVCDYSYYEIDGDLYVANQVTGQISTQLEVFRTDSNARTTLSGLNPFQMSLSTHNDSQVTLFGVNEWVDGNTFASLVTLDIAGSRMQLEQIDLHDDEWTSSNFIDTFELGGLFGLVVEYTLTDDTDPFNLIQTSRSLLILISVQPSDLSVVTEESERNIAVLSAYALVTGLITYVLYRQYRNRLSQLTTNELYPDSVIERTEK